jgi:tetratricopeptide (TPR) repeat protein
MPRFRLSRHPTIITRADQARAAGEWQHAARLYRVALERTPHNPPIWIQYGHALKESGSPTEAETAYRIALAYQPADADAHLQLGHALKLQGKRAEAETAYRQALALDRSSAEAARELTAFGWTRQRLAEAADRSAAAPARDEPPATAAINDAAPRFGGRRGKEGLITRADRARSARQWPVAARLYRKALDRSPDDPPIWVQYGHALKECGDPAEAEQAYRAALSYAPGVADTHLQLGHALKLQGKTEEAQAAYLRAFALDPALPHPGAELGGLGWSESQLRELRSWRTNEPSFAPPLDFEFAIIERDPIGRSQPNRQEYNDRPDDIEWVIENTRLPVV